MQRPDVTIVILNYNTFRLVHQCIQSTLAETQKVKMERRFKKTLSGNNFDKKYGKLRFF